MQKPYGNGHPSTSRCTKTIRIKVPGALPTTNEPGQKPTEEQTNTAFARTYERLRRTPRAADMSCGAKLAPRFHRKPLTNWSLSMASLT
ncbi:unnamed protein product, partial [Iphiclides podalirius]